MNSASAGAQCRDGPAAERPACPEPAVLALHRVVAANGVPFYRSLALHRAGFAHAFSTRHGGVSSAPFDTMNLGVAQAPGECDTDANIEKNAALLMSAAGVPDAAMVRVRQVHGADVHECSPTDRYGPPLIQADAVTSRQFGVAPCVRTADCVPVLLACPRTGCVAAVHAGWRGVVAGVVTRAVEALRAQGARAESLLAAIGPGIGCSEYEVGADVAEQFERADLEACVERQRPMGAIHVDCAAAVRLQMIRAGIPVGSIEGGALCTVSTRGADGRREFFSYRRDGARSGRMAAVIAPARGC